MPVKSLKDRKPSHDPPEVERGRVATSSGELWGGLSATAQLRWVAVEGDAQFCADRFGEGWEPLTGNELCEPAHLSGNGAAERVAAEIELSKLSEEAELSGNGAAVATVLIVDHGDRRRQLWGVVLFA